MASPTVRWTILTCLLGATLVGVFYPIDEGMEARPPRTQRKAAAATAPMLVAVPAATGEMRANVDPFAPRAWQTQPVSLPVATAAVVPEFVGPPPPPPPVPAPALPFQYMGRLTAEGPTVVYLSRGDQTLIARSGETLESIYRILEITPLKIDFLHVPTGEKQSLNIPAASN